MLSSPCSAVHGDVHQCGRDRLQLPEDFFCVVMFERIRVVMFERIRVVMFEQ